MYVNSESAPPAIKEAADKCRARYAPGSPDNKLGVPYLSTLVPRTLGRFGGASRKTL